MKLGKRWRSLTAVAAMVAGLAMAAPVGAQAAGTDPDVRAVSRVVTTHTSSPDVAEVIGVYRCFGGQSIHLWVSVKQGGPDPTAEGSGSTSTSWYDTNPPGGTEPLVNCDGRYHRIIVPVVRHSDKQPLVPGQAWVQFCLVAPGPGGPFGIVASISQWDKVAIRP